jgi:hypothetical protein
MDEEREKMKRISDGRISGIRISERQTIEDGGQNIERRRQKVKRKGLKNEGFAFV